MSYPVSTDVFSTKVDGVDSYLAAHINAVQASIVAVETELGTGLRGTLTNLAARLAVGLNNDGTLKTAGITSLPSNTVDTASIQALAVTAAKIANNTITAAQIAANTITAAQIANGSVGALQIASGAVGTTQLANLAVTNAILAALSVTADKFDASLKSFHETFTSVKGTAAADIRANAAAAAGTYTTGITQPAGCRGVMFTMTNNTGGTITFANDTITLNGVNSLGQAVAIVKSFVGVSTANGATQVFQFAGPVISITSLVMAGGQTASVNFSLGNGQGFGLTKPLPAPANILKVVQNRADVTGTSLGVAGTPGWVQLAAVADGDNIEVWYTCA